jgi:hypothetical protein
MIELIPESDAERIALTFIDRMQHALGMRNQFEVTIRNVAVGSLAGSIWHHIQTWGDTAIVETYIHDLIESYALPAVMGHLAETQEKSIRDRLETIVGVMDEKVRMLGGSAVKIHGMKASKLQRAVLETTLHAEYLACYTVRRLATDGLATLTDAASNPSRNELP